MVTPSRLAACLLAGFAVLTLAACTTPPPAQPLDIEQPVDAFNAVGPPHLSNTGPAPGGLSSDVRRLQNARRLYELSQQQQLQAVEHRQHVCREQANSRRVPVQAPGKFYYCETQPRTSVDVQN